MEGYYRQMIEELPEITNNREEQVQLIQHEYRRKIAEEVQQCQVHATIEPVSFCAVTIPFRRDRYTLRRKKRLPIPKNLSIERFSESFFR